MTLLLSRYPLIFLNMFIIPHLQDAEAAITASRSARDEALSTRQRIEADLSSPASKLEPEAGAPAYYGLASTARRESRDLDTKVRLMVDYSAEVYT